MRTKEQISDQIKKLEQQIGKQRNWADFRRGDSHDKSRDRAILVLRGMISSLKWVLK